MSITSLTVGNYDIQCWNNGDLFLPMTVKTDGGVPLDFTGYRAKMEVRLSPGAPNAHATLTSENGYLIFGGSLGNLTVFLPASATQLLPASEMVYDLLLFNGSNNVIRLLQGKFIVNRGITRV
jgi:hypothetical protein